MNFYNQAKRCSENNLKFLNTLNQMKNDTKDAKYVSSKLRLLNSDFI